MSRILLTIKYDGTDFCGFQTQDNGTTVQALVESALFKLTGERIRIHGASRTDSGVHAAGQRAHFDTGSSIPPEKFAYALNTMLPPTIRISTSECVADDFHARFDACGKHYRYRILNTRHDDPFLCRYSLHVHRPLDFEKMCSATALLLGEHDFSAFKSTGTTLKTHIRKISLSEFSREGELISYDIIGSGFMYNMVRIIVGTFIEIGLGLRDKGSIERALLNGQRSELGATAPARGLTLLEVLYD